MDMNLLEYPQIMSGRFLILRKHCAKVITLRRLRGKEIVMKTAVLLQTNSCNALLSKDTGVQNSKKPVPTKNFEFGSNADCY